MEPEIPRAGGPEKIRAAYQKQDRALIRLIEQFCPYNEEYYIENQHWLRVRPPQFSPESDIKIETQQLLGDGSEVRKMLEREFHRLFAEVTFVDWVREIWHLSPGPVVHLKFLLFRIGKKLRRFLHQYKAEKKFRYIESQVS